VAWADGDFDSDGVVTVTDLNKVLTNYNKTTGLKTVPEPSGVAFLCIGVVGLLAYACRKQRGM
jgi:hypothetical protein